MLCTAMQSHNAAITSLDHDRVSERHWRVLIHIGRKLLMTS